MKFQTNLHLIKSNPLLEAGEVAYESDTKKYKLGDGIKPYNKLKYKSFNSEVQAVVTLIDTLIKSTVTIADEINIVVKCSADNISRQSYTFENNATDQQIVDAISADLLLKGFPAYSQIIFAP